MGKNFITVIFTGCACGLLAYGQSNSTTPSDSMFMQKAAEANTAEVQLGKLAQQKGELVSVQNFGKRMANDHSQANEQLQSIASTAGVTLPTALNAKDQALYDRLSGLSGSAFDRAYMRAMVADHMRDVSQFQKESETAQDQAVRNFASNTLPTLEDHLRKARKVRHDLGISATAEANHTPESALQK
jgi:putative membrane protein